MAFVYWIHLEEHKDVFTEGYVGITTQTVKQRFRCHKSLAKAGEITHLYAAMRKHGDKIIVTPLLDADIDYCRNIEFKLRPTHNVGWNIGVGGAKTTLGYRHTPESLEKISKAGMGRKITEDGLRRIGEAHKGMQHSDEARKAMSESKKLLLSAPWINPAANLNVWAAAKEIYQVSRDINSFSPSKVGKYFLLSPNQASTLCKKLQIGWNPSEDPLYLSWLEDYKQKECNESTYAT